MSIKCESEILDFSGSWRKPLPTLRESFPFYLFHLVAYAAIAPKRFDRESEPLGPWTQHLETSAQVSNAKFEAWVRWVLHGLTSSSFQTALGLVSYLRKGHHESVLSWEESTMDKNIFGESIRLYKVARKLEHIKQGDMSLEDIVRTFEQLRFEHGEHIWCSNQWIWDT